MNKLLPSLALTTAILTFVDLPDYLYTNGDIIDTPGKAVVASVVLGAGDALEEQGKIDELTAVRLDLIEADMHSQVRLALQSAEQNARAQALRGEWTVDTLNSWMDAMIVDADLIQDLAKSHQADLMDSNITAVHDNAVVAELVDGQPESFAQAVDAIVLAEAFIEHPVEFADRIASVDELGRVSDRLFSDIYGPDASTNNDRVQEAFNLEAYDPFEGFKLEPTEIKSADISYDEGDTYLKF